MNELDTKIVFSRPAVGEGGSLPKKYKPIYDLMDYMPPEMPVFWEIKQMTKESSIIKVNQRAFIEFLEYAGFRKVLPENGVGSGEFVRVHHNILYPISVAKMKDYLTKFFDWALQGDGDAMEIEVTDQGHTLASLIDYCYQNAEAIFKVGKLEMMKTFEGEMYRATKNKNAFFFKDVWIEVTATGSDIKEYKDLPLNMAIWENSVVNFEIKPYSSENTKCDFQEFIWLITGGKSAQTDEDKKMAESRKSMLEQAMGYLLHPFYEGSLRAILLTDVGSSMEKANGRTGKGLIATALSKITNTAIIQAKRWTSTDKFNFEQADKDTQLIVLDDLASGFQSEWIFNVITEGVVVKKIYQQPFTIRSKVMVNTNTMMKGEGSSTRGRFLEIEIDNFFSDKFKPVDYFGRNFFSNHDWNKDEWGSFFWYLVNCSYQNLVNVGKGLDCGVDYIQSANIEQKRILRNIEQDFFEFMEMKCSTWMEPKFTEKTSRLFEIKDIRTDYLEDQNDKYRKLSNQKVRSWITEFCDFKGFTLELVKKPSNRPQYAILFEKSLFKQEDL